MDKVRPTGKTRHDEVFYLAQKEPQKFPHSTKIVYPWIWYAMKNVLLDILIILFHFFHILSTDSLVLNLLKYIKF